jgi:hypothetical protein
MRIEEFIEENDTTLNKFSKRVNINATRLTNFMRGKGRLFLHEAISIEIYTKGKIKFF